MHGVAWASFQLLPTNSSETQVVITKCEEVKSSLGKIFHYPENRNLSLSKEREEL